MIELHTKSNMFWQTCSPKISDDSTEVETKSSCPSCEHWNESISDCSLEECNLKNHIN